METANKTKIKSFTSSFVSAKEESRKAEPRLRQLLNYAKNLGKPSEIPSSQFTPPLRFLASSKTLPVAIGKGKTGLGLVSVKKLGFSKRKNFSLSERSEFGKISQKRSILAGGSRPAILAQPFSAKGCNRF